MMMKWITLLIIFLPLPVWAQNRYVQPKCGNGITTYEPVKDTCSGGNQTSYSTIRNGVANGGPGIILNIRGGTYTESLSQDSGHVVRSGSPGNPFIIQTYPGETVTWHADKGSDTTIVIDQPTTSWITFQGSPNTHSLIIDGINAVGETIYLGGGASHIVFQYAEIRNAAINNVQIGQGGSATTGSFFEIRHSLVHDSRTSHCFYFSPAWDSVIDDNEIYNCDGYGIQIFEYPDSHYTVANGGDGSVGHHNDRNVVSNNRLHDNWKPTYREGPIEAVTIQEGTQNQVHHNVFYNNQTGIGVGGDAHVTTYTSVYNNTFYNNANATLGHAAITVKAGAANTYVINNIMYQNYADYVDTNLFLEVNTGPITATNNFCSLGTGLFGCMTGTTNGTNNFGNPLFTNQAANDFTLQSASTAIDKGVASICPSCGSNGVAITLSGYQGKAPDPGAFEFTTGQVTPLLIAAYGFEEASGTGVVDSSGNNQGGNFGAGVTRNTSGKFGASLTFDGTGAVTIPDTNLLDLTNAFTLSAAFFPTVAQSTFIAGIVKPNGSQDYSYHFYATVQGMCATGGIMAGTDSSREVCAAAPLQVNAWTCVAATYDGQNLRLWTTQGPTMQNVATFAASGNMTPSTDPLLIGNSQFGGEGFVGRIDEVRVYNVALTNVDTATLNAGNHNLSTDCTTKIAPSIVTPPLAPILRLSSTLKLNAIVKFAMPQ
jgi:hypothetical protein